jgi:NAD(P)H-dependent FMN reductase
LCSNGIKGISTEPIPFRYLTNRIPDFGIRFTHSTMPHIEIISSSVRTGRNSHRAALYFKNYLEENKLATAHILDLNAYQFPLFEERLRLQPVPSAPVLEFAGKVKAADGIIMVTPEYNGGYPASLKNVIDLLYDEWYRKPVAIATVSDGIFGGSQVITSLQFSLWKIRAWTVPAMFPVPKVKEMFDENGTPSDKTAVDKRAQVFVQELLWCVEAKKRMASE